MPKENHYRFPLTERNLQIPEVTPQRYDGAGSGLRYDGIYGIGSYTDAANTPVVLDKPQPFIELTIHNPVVPLQPIEQLLNPSDNQFFNLGIKTLDLLVTGHYFQRYDQRVKDYNSGKIGSNGQPTTYDEFVQATHRRALDRICDPNWFGLGGQMNIVSSGMPTRAVTLLDRAVGSAITV